MITNRFRFSGLCLALLLLPGVARADDDSRAVIQRLSDQLIEVMKHGPALGLQGREEKLQPVVAASFDMLAMTRGTLGPAGAKLSPEDAQKIADAYLRFSVATYADQFKKWDGERFEVDAPQPADNGFVVVPSRIVSGSGVPTSIDYRMKEEDGHWRIVDVLFDGAISQVAMRRSELLPLFRRDGVAGIVTTLDNKSQSLAEK